VTYQAGIGPGIAFRDSDGVVRRVRPHGPRIFCDGCKIVWHISPDRPPAWFLNGKAPPRWKLVREGDKRTDLCPRCKNGEVGA